MFQNAATADAIILSTIGDRAFPVAAAARVWNELTRHVMSAPSPLRVFWQLTQDASFQPFLSRLPVVREVTCVLLQDTRLAQWLERRSLVGERSLIYA